MSTHTITSGRQAGFQFRPYVPNTAPAKSASKAQHASVTASAPTSIPRLKIRQPSQGNNLANALPTPSPSPSVPPNLSRDTKDEQARQTVPRSLVVEQTEAVRGDDFRHIEDVQPKHVTLPDETIVAATLPSDPRSPAESPQAPFPSLRANPDIQNGASGTTSALQDRSLAGASDKGAKQSSLAAVLDVLALVAERVEELGKAYARTYQRLKELSFSIAICSPHLEQRLEELTAGTGRRLDQITPVVTTILHLMLSEGPTRHEQPQTRPEFVPNGDAERRVGSFRIKKRKRLSKPAGDDTSDDYDSDRSTRGVGYTSQKQSAMNRRHRQDNAAHPNDEADQLWGLDRIIDHRVVRGRGRGGPPKRQFLCVWTGSDDPSWNDGKNCVGTTALEQYEEQTGRVFADGPLTLSKAV